MSRVTHESVGTECFTVPKPPCCVTSPYLANAGIALLKKTKSKSRLYKNIYFIPAALHPTLIRGWDNPVFLHCYTDSA